MSITLQNVESTDFNSIPVDNNWESSNEKELLMHRIHHYPAKFKHFIVSKSLEYAELSGNQIRLIGDIFCGCGTTALEAKRRNIDFWGCDINPVATLIAKVKSQKYNDQRLKKYYEDVLEKFRNVKTVDSSTLEVNERIVYWFKSKQICDLHSLLNSINQIVPKGKYRNFFLAGFSNILKCTSTWLAKSIKPQKDPAKSPQDVLSAFDHQISLMRKANKEAINAYKSSSKTKIVTTNFLKFNSKWPKLDIVITSPPYVTSYDYADLHQLSSLWLGYADDYRNLRKGSIGCKQVQLTESTLANMSGLGQKTFDELMKVDKIVAKSVAKYFIDIEIAVKNSRELLVDNGLAFFIIGNTKYRSIEVNNAKYIAECMIKHDFQEISVIKRKISSKNLTPFRDERGKFSSSKNQKEVYSYEYVLIGKKGAA
jgi:DNA modification methylase